VPIIFDHNNEGMTKIGIHLTKFMCQAASTILISTPATEFIMVWTDWKIW